MMPNITRGKDIGGLVRYLAGPGRANEHTDPHVITGDAGVQAWHTQAGQTKEATAALARYLEEPRRLFETEVTGGHVWHCSLSLKAEEGLLPDAQWGAIATDFIAEMGFVDDGKAEVRWVAMRHGVSTAGNDHVHLAVSLVREDGTKVSVWNDRPRAQQTVGLLEQRHGLQVLESRAAGRGDRGLQPAELVKAERERVEPARTRLARTVRGTAAATKTEADFVRILRSKGVLFRPRFAKGGQDQVQGYSVALRPTVGEEPVWFGGGRLAKDLTLPRLRHGWAPDPENTAVGEWRTTTPTSWTGSGPSASTTVDPRAWTAATNEIAALRERLRAVPVGDRAAWAEVAGDAAGVIAAWSLAVEGDRPGPLAAASRSLARSAQIRAGETRSRSRRPPTKSAAVLLAAMASPHRTAAQAALMIQIANTIKALHDAHVAIGEAERAAELANVAREQLGVQAPLPLVTADPGAVVRSTQSGRHKPKRDGNIER